MMQMTSLNDSEPNVVSCCKTVTHKAPSKIHSRRHCIFYFYVSEETSLDILCQSFAWQTIHMECQLTLKKKIKMLSAAVVIGASRVNITCIFISMFQVKFDRVVLTISPLSFWTHSSLNLGMSIITNRVSVKKTRTV